MSSVRAEWDSPEEFIDFLQTMGAQSKAQSSSLTGRIAGFFRSSTVRRIKRDQLGVDNAPVTKAVKQGDTPLQDTGAFQQSIVARWDEETAAAGSPLRHASALQSGAEITPQSAEKLAFPAGEQTRALQRRYGFDFTRLIDGMREDGWDVWVMENAIMADDPETDADSFPLLIRADEVEIPAYRPFRITDQDEADIRGLIRAWLQDIDPR